MRCADIKTTSDVAATRRVRKPLLRLTDKPPDTRIANDAYHWLRDAKNHCGSERAVMERRVIEHGDAYVAYLTLRDVHGLLDHTQEALRCLILQSGNAHVSHRAVHEIHGWLDSEALILKNKSKVKPVWTTGTWSGVCSRSMLRRLRGRHRVMLLLLVFSLALTVGAPLANADVYTDCSQQEDPDRAIRGCTLIISQAREAKLGVEPGADRRAWLRIRPIVVRLKPTRV